ncbi:hypothetical protein BofuT4_uP135870.1 [Botrytis cinerea T4]|uniref:Uncharacterized protein n=1 Tax=Botryotinia fuckeliana (strain T4) TaxID=999810 RepID=G2YPJ4_BOTF4|nr:hypothetical protein BofuT4_uP135870.1 [Botrytis cinerea T4]
MPVRVCDRLQVLEEERLFGVLATDDQEATPSDLGTGIPNDRR